MLTRESTSRAYYQGMKESRFPVPVCSPGALLDILLPRTCLMCGSPAGECNLCADCLADLPRMSATCSRCALPLPANDQAVCGACSIDPPPWRYAIAACDYRFPVKQLVRRFKFNRSLACGEVLMGELVSLFDNSGRAPPDAIAPVPLHRLRQFTRGYNQADLIARRMGRESGIPVLSDLLQRTRTTRAQTGLNAGQRRRNTRGAFRLKPRYSGGCPDRIALVDDVMTTGATLEACSRVLLSAGVKEISVWVAARAPPP